MNQDHPEEEAVCAACIEEPTLASFIEANATLLHCSYCGRRQKKRPFAVPFRELRNRILESLESEYNDAAGESVPFESAEGGYQFSTMDTYDLLEDLGLLPENDDLRQRLIEALPDRAWIRRNPLSLTPEDRLRFSWEEFVKIVKHRVRYLLFPSPGLGDNEILGPEEMLDALGDLIAEVGLVRTLPLGTRFFRVRIHKPDQVPANTIAAMGPPKTEYARFPNRMSPSGIPMFYGALQEATALAETYVRHDGTPAAATIAVFETISEVHVLDLTDLPEIPSIFAEDDEKRYRSELIFLHNFVEDFTKPITKDGREHIEYVPTQVVSEYIRYRLPQRVTGPIHGIVYSSARTEDGTSCVLFVSGEDCVDDWEFGKPTPPPFKLIEELTRTVPIDTMP